MSAKITSSKNNWRNLSFYVKINRKSNLNIVICLLFQLLERIGHLSRFYKNFGIFNKLILIKNNTK